MCEFNLNESFLLVDHHFEFNRSGRVDELGLVIVPYATGVPIVRLFRRNYAYRIVGNELQVGSMNLNTCTPVADNLAWPVPNHFLRLNKRGIIGIGDIRDNLRYSFSLNLSQCPVQLGYNPQEGRVLLTFSCENEGACNPDEADYDPNACFSATLLPE